MHVSAEEKETAAYQIFNNYYRAKVQNKFLYSDDFLKHRGIISTTPDEARAEMESMRTTVLTIAEMAKLSYEGAPMELIIPEDASKIYDLIILHLNDWLSIVNRTIYDSLPPSEDLYILDELASKLHPYVARRRMRELNEGRREVKQIHSFIGARRPDELYTLDKAAPYKNIAPAIINRARSYYGAKEFGFEI